MRGEARFAELGHAAARFGGSAGNTRRTVCRLVEHHMQGRYLYGMLRAMRTSPVRYASLRALFFAGQEKERNP